MLTDELENPSLDRPNEASDEGALQGPRLARLTLTGFRNHRFTDLRFVAPVLREDCSNVAQHVALSGPNGAGKTNILEAISLFSPGRGMRRARYGDMLAASGTETRSPSQVAVAAQILPFTSRRVLQAADDDLVKIGTGFIGPEPTARELRIDGETARSSDALTEYLTILWLTPAMDGLFTGGASDRRRFFDRMVMALHPTHGRMANRFETAMRARNKLFDQGATDPVWYEGLEAEMAAAGAAIQTARLETLDLLRRAIDEARDAVLAFPFAALNLQGFDTFEDADTYRQVLAANRPRDRMAGRALDGPHRVDLLVRHGPKDVEARLASTGEQKALLIGLVLAQARLVKRETGRAAVLLLDEIAAHLDEARRAALYALCDELGGQTFMTGTDVSLFDALPEGSLRFSVLDGAVAPPI